MDAWLSELEMTLNEEPIVSNNLYEEEQWDMLNEVLGYNFSLDDFATPSPTKLSDQQLDFIVLNHSSDDDQRLLPNDHDHPQNNTATITKTTSKMTLNGKRRRRDPDQAHIHIIAERKRRELITQQFIALSALIPGLKKVDKLSILEEAINYFQQMQDKVNQLEKAKSNKVNVDHNGGYQNNTKPAEIQVKMTEKTILLKISCVKRKGILGQIYQQVENYVKAILDTNVLAFENSTFDITILAQMVGGVECAKQVRDLVTSLHSAIGIA